LREGEKGVQCPRSRGGVTVVNLLGNGREAVNV